MIAASDASHLTSYVIPTIHPAYVLRQGAPITDAIVGDLRRAVRIAEGGEPQINDNVIAVLPSTPGGLEKAVRTARAWMARWRQLRCPVAVDVETGSLRYMTARLYSAALSGADGLNTGVGFTLHDLHTLPVEAERVLVEDMRALLADIEVPKVAHNAPFDLSVLEARGYPVRGPLLDTMALDHLVQPDTPHSLGWVAHSHVDTDPWKMGEEGEKLATVKDVVTLLVYNCKDAIRTAQLVDPLMAAIYERGMNDRLISYQMALMKLAARMQLRGVPVNMATRERKGKELMAEIQQHKEAMKLYLHKEGLGFEDFDPDKRAHLVEVLYGKKFLGFTPARYTPKSGDPSVSYKDFAAFADHPFVYNLVLYVEKRVQHTTMYAHRTKGGDLTAFSKALHADNRLHVMWGMGTKGSRFSSRPNCFDAETEVLTDQGWLKFPDAVKRATELRFAQYYPSTERIDFTKATAVHEQGPQEVLLAEGQQVSICATGDHRMLLREYNPNKHPREVTVEPLASFPHHKRFVHAGQFKFGKHHVPEDLMRLTVACQADGSWDVRGHRTMRFDFKKKYKYRRLRKLLDACEVEYTFRERPEEPKHRYRVYLRAGPVMQAIKGYIGDERCWGSWVLSLTKESATWLLDELKHWDGKQDKNREFYYSAIKTNVNWVQALAILLGRRATLLWAGTCYRVTIAKNKAFSAARVKPKLQNCLRNVYCVTVPSGFIVVRREGKTLIVGNCQNDPIPHREIYEAPDGWVFVGCDKDQLELRIIAGMAGVPSLVQEMQDPACDPHSMIAGMIYGKHFHEADPKKKKDIRGGTKTVTYASLYNAGPNRIYQTIRTNKKVPLRIRAMLDEETVRFIHAGIFGNFVEIPDFHQDNLRRASQPPYRLVIPPLGRTRYFPVQPPPFTEIGNWPIQTYGSDVVGMEMVHIQDRLDRECPDAQIIIHGHDAVYIECRERHAEQVVRIVNEEFGSTPLTGPAGQVNLTGAAKIKKRLNEMG